MKSHKDIHNMPIKYQNSWKSSNIVVTLNAYLSLRHTAFNYYYKMYNLLKINFNVT
jgi:hypothetical protein